MFIKNDKIDSVNIHFYKMSGTQVMNATFASLLSYYFTLEYGLLFKHNRDNFSTSDESFWFFDSYRFYQGDDNCIMGTFAKMYEGEQKLKIQQILEDLDLDFVIG